MPSSPSQSTADLFRRAFDLHKSGAFDAALPLYEQIIAIDPTHFDALHLSGVIHVQRNRPDRAVDLIGRALRAHPRQQAAHSNRGVALLALNNPAAALADFDMAVELQPDQAAAHYNRGKALADLARPDEALAAFDTALRLQPRYADAHLMRGMVFTQCGDHLNALGCFEQAAACDGGAAHTHFNRGNALYELGRHQDAIAAYTQALSLQPGHVDALNNRGNVYRDLNRHQEALSDYERAATYAPDFVGARVNASLCELALGRYAEGWRNYEWRFKTHELAPALNGLREQRWDGGQSLEGKTILLIAEQGLGDTLQFCRFASAVAAKAAHVGIVAPAGLKRLLQTVPGIAEVYIEGDARPHFDFYCPLLSLPAALGIRVEAIPNQPYLRAESTRIAAWAQRFKSSSGLRVGLVWAGSPRADQPAAHAIDKKRSLPLSAFAPLRGVPGTAFFSLQKGEPAAQIAGHDWIADFTADLSDFADTAAFTANLDLVISCDTSVVHLAGGMGKPVWMLNRFSGCWRWLPGRNDSPWYPTLRLFSQHRPGDWSKPVDEVRTALAAEASGR
jgi:tetratricopeptide (TPR) repeat protein